MYENRALSADPVAMDRVAVVATEFWALYRAAKSPGQQARYRRICRDMSLLMNITREQSVGRTFELLSYLGASAAIDGVQYELASGSKKKKSRWFRDMFRLLRRLPNLSP